MPPTSHDVLIGQVEGELGLLQDELRERLKETAELGDLNKLTLKSSMQIEEHTAQLETTSRATKWKWLIEYAKWTALAALLVILLLWMFYKTFIK